MAYDNTLAAPVTGTPVSVANFGSKVVGNIQALASPTVIVEAFGPTTNTATGDGKKHLPIQNPNMEGMVLKAVHAYVVTAGVTGTTDIQIHNVTDGVDMLSTKLTIDSGETGSETAAVAAVIDTDHDDVSVNDILRIDIDDISTTAAKGLYVTLIFGF